jgi:hypothetical protein
MKMLLVAGIVGLWASAAGADVSLTQDGKKLVVKNSVYEAEFDGNAGYVLSALTVGQPRPVRLSVKGGLTFAADGEPEKYIGHFASKPQVFAQADGDVSCTVIENSPQRVSFRLTWRFIGGSVTDTITCLPASPLIKHDVELSFERIMVEANYRIAAYNLGKGDGRGNLFYPDKRLVPGVYDRGLHSPCPTWKFAWNPKHEIGLGLIAPEGQDFNSIKHSMRSLKNDWRDDLTLMELQHKQLRYRQVPGGVKFSFSMIAGGALAEVEQLAKAQLPKPKDIALDEVWPRKLVVKEGQDNITTVALSNNSQSAKTVKLVSKALWGVDREEIIDTRELELAPASTNKFEIAWQGKPMTWGMTFRTEAFVDGALVDSKEEYCAVSNFAPAAAGISILNVGMAWEEGTEPAWIEQLRRGYIGTFEYYCWAPSTIGGLAPQEDKWDPHTESQAAYQTPLTKKFLKTLIDDAHSNGISVYALITGLFNHRKGLENPELFQYCKNGQPSLYNGRIYGDRRFATGKPNAFTPEFAYEWGKEMGLSVDMFGWDGCRWDWSFIPNAPCDPLYADRAGDAQEWYDWKGAPSRKLYPSADATAQKATAQWRRGVTEMHPDFAYGTNFRGSAEQFRNFPRHSVEQSTNSLVLFEYLLNFSKEEHSTWQKWAAALTDACQRVRPHGAQPMVGSMRGLLAGTVSRNLAQYVCFASGVKWWEWSALPYGIDQSYKSYRFMTRFSEYYFDTAFKLLPENRRMKEITVTGGPRIFWQQFVYERKVAGNRELTVHLINLPAGDYICQRHEVPATVKNIVVQARPHPGEKVSEAFAMLPNPAPHAIKLEINNNGAVLPELVDAAIVLFRFEKR